jgi:hypothetical protein
LEQINAIRAKMVRPAQAGARLSQTNFRINRGEANNR